MVTDRMDQWMDARGKRGDSAALGCMQICWSSTSRANAYSSFLALYTAVKRYNSNNI